MLSLFTSIDVRVVVVVVFVVAALGAFVAVVIALPLNMAHLYTLE